MLPKWEATGPGNLFCNNLFRVRCGRRRHPVGTAYWSCPFHSIELEKICNHVTVTVPIHRYRKFVRIFKKVHQVVTFFGCSPNPAVLLTHKTVKMKMSLATSDSFFKGVRCSLLQHPLGKHTTLWSLGLSSFINYNLYMCKCRSFINISCREDTEMFSCCTRHQIEISGSVGYLCRLWLSPHHIQP